MQAPLLKSEHFDVGRSKLWFLWIFSREKKFKEKILRKKFENKKDYGLWQYAFSIQYEIFVDLIQKR